MFADAPRRRPARLALVLALALAALPWSASAFGTINSLGQHAEHEKITRLALAPLGFEPGTLDEIAGARGTFGAVGAPDNPARGLLTSSAAHCDGGDYLAVQGYPQAQGAAQAALYACRQWTFDAMETAVRAAAGLLDGNGRVRESEIPGFIPCVYDGGPGRAKCEVLDALGLALHAAQDFYAHTNWTDQTAGPLSLANPPGLGQPGPADFIDPFAPGGFPSGLMSGCFEGVPEGLFCGGRVRHEALNKDTGQIKVKSGAIGAGTTPRASGNDNFARAVRAAIADSQQKWAYFEARVIASYGTERGNRMICAIKRDNPAATCR